MSAPDTIPGTPPRPGSVTRQLALGLPRAILSTACLLALLAMAVSILHFLFPTPLLFALLMSVGNGAYALAIVLYLAVILSDLRRRRVL